MRLIWRALSRWLGIGGLMTTVAASPGLAAAATAIPAGNRQACTGAVSAPGTLAGTNSNLVITGTCVADAGPVNVTGNLTVAAGGALTTSFGLDDQTGTVVRNTSIRGNVVENGGGAGTGCLPAAIFNQYFGLPEYSDYTSNTIDGNLVINGLGTCCTGAFRATVRGNLQVTDNMGAPGATGIAASTVCGRPGECGLIVILPDPGPDSGVPWPPCTVTFQHASVKLH
jgi:hypothetical protein